MARFLGQRIDRLERICRSVRQPGSYRCMNCDEVITLLDDSDFIKVGAKSTWFDSSQHLDAYCPNCNGAGRRTTFERLGGQDGN